MMIKAGKRERRRIVSIHNQECIMEQYFNGLSKAKKTHNVPPGRCFCVKILNFPALSPRLGTSGGADPRGCDPMSVFFRIFKKIAILHKSDL